MQIVEVEFLLARAGDENENKHKTIDFGKCFRKNIFCNANERFSVSCKSQKLIILWEMKMIEIYLVRIFLIAGLFWSVNCSESTNKLISFWEKQTLTEHANSSLSAIQKIYFSLNVSFGLFPCMKSFRF